MSSIIKEFLLFFYALAILSLAIMFIFTIIGGFVYGFQKFSFERFFIVISFPTTVLLITKILLKRYF